MKNLLAILLMLFLSVTSFAQQTAHARAKLFTVGHRDTYSKEIVWNGTPTECNILIEIKENDVVIWSKEKQHYHNLYKMQETSDGVMYRMVDDNGNKCNFYIGPIEGSEAVFIAIEYNDYAWMYTCINE